VPTATITPTTAPVVSTISVSLSAVISNITVAEFNETAFKAAVIDVIKTTVLPTAVSAPQVIISGAAQATTTTASRRHLQAIDTSVTLAYDIINIPDEATAAAIRTKLPSKDGNDNLFNIYKALDNSTATAITTTVLTRPFKQPSKKLSPVGAIVGSVVAILTVAAIAYGCWRKKEVISRRMPKKHTTTTFTGTVIDNASDVEDKAGSFTKAIIADNPRRNSSDRKSGSMLIHLNSGIIIDGVHKGETSTDDDIEHGTTGITSIIDSSIVRNASNGTGQSIQASSTSTTASDTIVTTAQHETPFTCIRSDITAPVDDTSVESIPHMTATATDSTIDAATAKSQVSDVQPTTNETIDAVSEQALVAKKQPIWTNKIGQASRLATTRMSTATQNAVAAHGNKAVLAYELVGAVAAHIPYVRQAYGLCNEIVQLFGASVHIDGNCAEIVAWAKDMQVQHLVHISIYMLYIHTYISYFVSSVHVSRIIYVRNEHAYVLVELYQVKTNCATFAGLSAVNHNRVQLIHYKAISLHIQNLKLTSTKLYWIK
jgi:hypothetical protein